MSSPSIASTVAQGCQPPRRKKPYESPTLVKLAETGLTANGRPGPYNDGLNATTDPANATSLS